MDSKTFITFATQVNVICYRRVSTPYQVQEGEGLSIQLDRITDFCNKHNYNLLSDGDFVDEGVSGKLEVPNRDGIVEMLSYCRERNSDRDQSKHIKFVIADKADRLSRDMLSQLYIEKELYSMGITVLFSAQEALNSTCCDGSTENPTNKLMRQIMYAFAEFDRAMTVQRLSDGLKKKAMNGSKPTGRQPFGYSYDKKRLTVVNEAEAKIVRLAFRLRASGISFQRIADIVNDYIHTYPDLANDFTPTNKDRTFAKSAIVAMLNNDYYCGVVTFAGEKNKGIHEAIISDVTWEQVRSHDKPPRIPWWKG